MCMLVFGIKIQNFLNLNQCLSWLNFISAIWFNDMAFMFQALDTFNTAIVSPIYYVMFTSLTIIASVIMFKVISIHFHWWQLNWISPPTSQCRFFWGLIWRGRGEPEVLVSILREWPPELSLNSAWILEVTARNLVCNGGEQEALKQVHDMTRIRRHIIPKN